MHLLPPRLSAHPLARTRRDGGPRKEETNFGALREHTLRNPETAMASGSGSRYASPISPAKHKSKARVAPLETLTDPSLFELPASFVTAAPSKPPKNAVSGIEWLGSIDGVFIRQYVLPLAALRNGFEPANRFMMAPLDASADIPMGHDLTSAHIYPTRMAMDGLPTMRAAEASECADRMCCPLTRGFTTVFVDDSRSAHFSFARESTCEPCACWPVFFTRAQRLAVLDRAGSLVARVIEPVAVCRACWTRTFVVVDADDQLLYTLRASDCGSQGGCNFCAPSCFNEAYDVDVFAPDGTYVASATWVWPGCACGGQTDRSNIVLRFPEDSTAEQRAGILGGVMLVEYTAMELKRIQEGNSSSAGGGGGAGYRASAASAAPAETTMERG